MASSAGVERKQGDNYPIQITILQDDGVTPHDLTGATEIKLGVSRSVSKKSPADADEISTGTIADAANGIVDFPVTAGMEALDVGDYHAEVQFVQSTYKRTTSTFAYRVIGQIITS